MRRGTITTLLGLSLAAGCGGAQDGAAGGAGAAAGGGAVEYRHQGADNTPTLNLGTYQYVPPGSGTRLSASAAGKVDPKVNYGLALRTAAIKLTGDLPSLDEIKAMQAAVEAGSSDPADQTLNPSNVYKNLITKYLNDKPRFARQMIQYWRDTLRMGGSTSGFVAATNNQRPVDLETAPRFAAALSVNGEDMRKLFTQASGTCPSVDTATGNFTAAACASKDGADGLNEGEHAGILTNPAFLAQYYSNYAFRRARMIQELFSCSKFPAEFSATPERGDGFLYTSPWPKLTITSSAKPPYQYNNGTAVFQNYAQRQTRGANGPVNTVVTDMSKYSYMSFNFDCASCHESLNHQAPLWRNYDGIGILRTASMVQTPIDDSPFAQLIDYVPPGEKTAYRYLKDAPTIKAFGQHMTEDPGVIRCFINRAWNRAMSRGDIVNELSIVPDDVTKDVVETFKAGNYSMKTALQAIYTHPNFIRY